MGVESADMADGGESGVRVVRWRLIWNNAMADFERRVLYGQSSAHQRWC